MLPGWPSVQKHLCFHTRAVSDLELLRCIISLSHLHACWLQLPAHSFSVVVHMTVVCMLVYTMSVSWMLVVLVFLYVMIVTMSFLRLFLRMSCLPCYLLAVWVSARSSTRHLNCLVRYHCASWLLELSINTYQEHPTELLRPGGEEWNQTSKYRSRKSFHLSHAHGFYVHAQHNLPL